MHHQDTYGGLSLSRWYDSYRFTLYRIVADEERFEILEVADVGARLAFTGTGAR